MHDALTRRAGHRFSCSKMYLVFCALRGNKHAKTRHSNKLGLCNIKCFVNICFLKNIALCSTARHCSTAGTVCTVKWWTAQRSCRRSVDVGLMRACPSIVEYNLSSVRDPRLGTQTALHCRHPRRHKACHWHPNLTLTHSFTSHFNRRFCSSAFTSSPSNHTISSARPNAVHAPRPRSSFLCCRNCADPPPRWSRYRYLWWG